MVESGGIMPAFSGKYYYTVEEKGRLIIPAPFREIISSNYSPRLYITNAAFDRCLHIYPYEEWTRLEEKVRGLPKMLEDVLNSLLTEACRTLGVPAGSIALYDEGSSLLTLKATQGVSSSFSQIVQWRVREGGLTDCILSKRVPTIIADVEKNPFIDNKILIEEGIKSLIAVPLFAGEHTIGILYLDDFQPRE